MKKYNLKNINISSYDMLMRYISEEDIMFHFFGPFSPNKHHRCVLYPEDQPSFYIFYDEYVNLRWLRFGYFNDRPMNPVDFVMLRFNLKFYHALNVCYQEIYLGKKRLDIDTTEYLRTKVKKKINLGLVLERDSFRDWELEFWNDYHITQKTLHKWSVLPCDGAWFNNHRWHYSKKRDPLYIYVHNLEKESFTFYRPWPKGKRSNRSEFRKFNITGHIMGLSKLPDKGNVLFITSSLKDVMIFDLLGYHAIAPHTERGDIGEQLVENLKQRFAHIYVAFDNDSTGVNASLDLTKKHDLKYWNVPKYYLGCKDPSDFAKVKSLDEVKAEIINKFKRDKII